MTKITSRGPTCYQELTLQWANSALTLFKPGFLGSKTKGEGHVPLPPPPQNPFPFSVSFQVTFSESLSKIESPGTNLVYNGNRS